MKECTQEEKQTKYNYVFYNFSGDYLQPIFWPLKRYEFVRIYERAFDGSTFMQKLFFLHWSAKLNRRVRMPGKKLWFRKMTSQDFLDDKPCCYLFCGGKYILEDYSLFDYIKRRNPQNKCIVFCYDLISKKHWNIDEVKRNCDYIITYDQGEAEKYDINLFQSIMYDTIADVTTPTEFDQDVYFLGYAKDRLQMIYDTFYALTKNGFRCRFLICGVPKEQQIVGDGLYYISPISYRENIENVKRSKCVLELIQGGSDSPTLRTEEAHFYRRKLLTNNKNMVNHPFFDKQNMRVFVDVNEIDTAFIREPIDYKSFKDSSEYDPYQLIEYLEKLLGGKNEPTDLRYHSGL